MSVNHCCIYIYIFICIHIYLHIATEQIDNSDPYPNYEGRSCKQFTTDSTCSLRQMEVAHFRLKRFFVSTGPTYTKATVNECYGRGIKVYLFLASMVSDY